MVGLIFSLVILGGLAAILGGIGIGHIWSPRDAPPLALYVSHAISAALHTAWILPASRRRFPMVVASGWVVSFYFCQGGIETLGLASGSFGYALLAEGIPLLLAMALAPRATWGERLARWRRARSEIGIQLRMGEGLLSWLPLAFRQFLVGSAALPPGGDYRRFVAELADAEQRLQIRLVGMVLPEQVRQSLQSSAVELVGRAEASAARIGFELEQMALAAAASCREQLERLDLPAEQQSALANQCESLFFELIAPACRVLNETSGPLAKEEGSYEPTF